MQDLFDRFWTWAERRLVREDGQAMVEYGLILAVITAVSITLFVTIGDTIADKLGALVTTLEGLGTD